MRSSVVLPLLFALAACDGEVTPDAGSMPDGAMDGGADATVDPGADAGRDGGDEIDAGEDVDAFVPSVPGLTVAVRTSEGAPIFGATVSIDGAERTTGLGGEARFDGLAAGDVIARVRASGYLGRTELFEFPSEVDATVTVHLLELGPPIRFDVANGVSVVRDDVSVRLPPGSVVDGSGAAVTGPVDLFITPIDPTTEAVWSAPGPMVGRATDGSDVLLDSLFMADVTLMQNGAELDIAPGRRIRIGFRVPDSLLSTYRTGNVVPAWWYDDATASWREESRGVIYADPRTPDERWWMFDAAHLTPWNSDRRGSSGCTIVTAINDETGEPIRGVSLASRGRTYEGISDTGVTNGSGSSCLESMTQNTAAIELLDAGWEVVGDATLMPMAPPEGGNARCGAGGSCGMRTVRMRAATCVRGTVEVEDGRSLAGVTVVGVFMSASGPRTSTAEVSDSGSFCLRGPRSAMGRVYAIRTNGMQTQRSSVAMVSTGDGTATCGGSCSDAGTLRFSYACVNGVIQDEAGRPMGGATVIASWDEDGEPGEAEATTGSDGSYCIEAQTGAAIDLFARGALSGGVRTTEHRTVIAAGAPAMCGASCTSAPTLSARGASCVRGNVQDSYANPAADVTVTALLDSAHSFATVTADTDADGNYCLEIPAGAGYSIRAEREVDQLVQTTMEILGSAPNTAAACGTDTCQLHAPLQFEEASCATGRLIDNFGEAIPDFALSYSYLGADGGNPITVTTDDEGRYCVGVPRNTSGHITAQRMLAADRNLRYADTIDFWGGNTAIACESGSCPMLPDLVLPRPTCYLGRLENPDGSPAASQRVDLTYDPLEGRPQSVNVYTGGDGSFCLTVPQGVEVTMAANYMFGATNVTAVTTFVAERGSAAQCSLGGCLPGPVLRAAPHSCTSGLVLDETSTPVAGATVIGQYVFAVSAPVIEVMATTGADGRYCLELPPGANVTLAAQVMVGGALHAGGGQFVPGTGTATCSTGGCATVPDIVVSEALGCIYGTLVTDGPSAHPAPAGTRIAFYMSEPNAGCEPGEDDPSSWGTVVGEGVTGDAGSFCIEVPIVPPGVLLWHGIDACNWALGDTNYLVRRVAGPIAPGACATSGCVGPVRLFAR